MIGAVRSYASQDRGAIQADWSDGKRMVAGYWFIEVPSRNGLDTSGEAGHAVEKIPDVWL